MNHLLGQSKGLFDEYIFALGEIGYRSYLDPSNEVNGLHRLRTHGVLQNKLDNMSQAEQYQYLKDVPFTLNVFDEIQGWIIFAESGKFATKLKEEKRSAVAAGAAGPVPHEKVVTALYDLVVSLNEGIRQIRDELKNQHYVYLEGAELQQHSDDVSVDSLSLGDGHDSDQN